MATTYIYTLSLHDALPILYRDDKLIEKVGGWYDARPALRRMIFDSMRYHPLENLRVLFGEIEDHRSEEHTSELQSRPHLVCRLLLEKKKNKKNIHIT